MSIENYYYLLINIFVVSVPLALSFDKKVHFYTRWKQFFPALTLVASIFIVWDIVFTDKGIWGFNPHYLTGINIVNLPLEEVLFFITIPYACTFIYDTIKAYLPNINFTKFGWLVYFIVAIFILYFCLFHLGKWYTTSAVIASIICLVFLVATRKEYFGRLAFTYFISLLPFLLVNGILTGSFIESPIVWYNSDQFSNIRLGTIPLEDFFYGFSLIALNLIGYEELLLRKSR